MTRTRTSWVAAFAAVLGTTSAAHAFKEAGHRAIEAAAYRELLKNSQGRAELRTLIKYGILNPPSAPIAEPSELTDPAFANYTVDSLVVESHFPDHLFDRQLQANRQCFHFNTSGSMYKRTDERYGDSLIPLGLVEDAYVECIGVADAVLRGVLFAPRASHEAGTGVYTLMHMIEDSFADSHVARDEQWNIIYIKPWNLRTWPRYFLGNKHQAPIRSHFSAEHHMGSDTRDLGYLVGPTDEDYEKKAKDLAYRTQVKECVDQGARLIKRHLKEDYAKHPITIMDMQGELVVPPRCLTVRAQQAVKAVADLLRMLAKLAPVAAQTYAGSTGIKEVPGLDEAWLAYRKLHLNHYDPYLTKHMAKRGPGQVPPFEEPRKDLTQSSAALAPRKFRESGLGLTTELRSGTPLWLGLENFLSRDTANHNRPVVLLDSFGWGVQVRLPITNELGENPVGVAFDFGLGLPIPVSELIGLNELQVFIGARARGTYTAQSVFEENTRHRFEFGLGGGSLDVIVGNTAWLGFDAPRYMYFYDFWSNEYAWQPTYFSFSGGLAIDAF
jgi:hypothetical protein